MYNFVLYLQLGDPVDESFNNLAADIQKIQRQGLYSAKLFFISSQL